MNETVAKVLEARIAALIGRVRTLAAERDEFHRETQELQSRLESRENDNAKLRAVLEEATRELRQEQGH
jgi:hypothetical protein